MEVGRVPADLTREALDGVGNTPRRSVDIVYPECQFAQLPLITTEPDNTPETLSSVIVAKPSSMGLRKLSDCLALPNNPPSQSSSPLGRELSRIEFPRGKTAVSIIFPLI